MHHHFPAEWTPHKRTWMAWPCRIETWGDSLELTRKNYALVANTIADFEPVVMLVNSKDVAEASRLLRKEVELLEMPIDDSWTRDTGPIYIKTKTGEKVGCDFVFNAWGDKYDSYDNDAAIARTILQHTGHKCLSSKLTMEGGGITTDGEGTAIITESCFLNKNRNPDWTKADIEAELKRTLGIKKTVWIPGDVEEIETDGHVDLLTVFLRPNLVLMEKTANKNNPRYTVFEQNRLALEGQLDAKNRPIKIEYVDMPDSVNTESEIFALSYVNFYFVNGGVIIPGFGVANDKKAEEKFKRLFPDRKIVQILVNDIAIGGGSIHCITCQEPV